MNAHVMVFIARGVLAGQSEREQRSPNFDWRHEAVTYGLRMLTEEHWTTFVIEERYYPVGAES